MARIQKILTVTQGGLLYTDIAEVVRWIDFQQCRINHAVWMPHANNETYDRCIAQCSFTDPVMPYIEFFSTPVIRLEFENPQHLRSLLRDIYRHGWKAYDID